MKRLALILAVLIASLPLLGSAQSLEAPERVEADTDGSFSYEWLFTAGPGSSLLAGAGWDGFMNVPGGEHGDCFCIPDLCLLEEGETTRFSVHGTLQDASQQGTVRNWVALCEGPSLNVFTAILPFGTMPVESKTWSQIKALYRASAEAAAK